MTGFTSIRTVGGIAREEVAMRIREFERAWIVGARQNLFAELPGDSNTGAVFK